MASKVAAEKAVWKFAEERKPHFAVNTVSPSSILGEPLNKSHVETRVAWVKRLYDGDSSELSRMPASKFPINTIR